MIGKKSPILNWSPYFLLMILILLLILSVAFVAPRIMSKIMIRSRKKTTAYGRTVTVVPIFAAS